MKIRNNFLLLHIAFLSIKIAPTDFKKVMLCENRLSLEVPKEWKYKRHYLKFSNYELKSDEELFDAKDSSFVTFNMYDSIYRRKVVINEERLKFEKEEISNHYKTVRYIESGVKSIGNVNVVFFKFRVANRSNKDAYMIKAFFKDSHNFYYEVEIFNFKEPVENFKPLADQIFNSLAIE